MASKLGPVSRILKLLKLERAEITAVYFYAILNGLIQLSLPLGVQAIVGFVLGASMRASLVVLIFLVVLGVLVMGILQVNQMKIIEKVQQKLFVRYSFAFAEHLPIMDLNRNNHLYLPELVNRFFDTPVLQKSLSKLLLDIPTATVQIIFGLLLLSFYHPAFIIFSLVLVLVLWLILNYSGKLGMESSLNESTSKYKVAAWLEESARMAKFIKFNRHNDLHLQKTDYHVSNYLGFRTKHFKVLLFQYNVLIIFKTVITAAMLTVGTILLVNQQLNIGQFIAAEIVILLVINSVEKLIGNLDSVYDTLTAVEKLSNLTETPIEPNGTAILSPAVTGLKLDIMDLSFGYTEDKWLLKDLNLNIASGQKVCIMGEQGSGKSTLLRLMAGTYTQYEGSLIINDIPLANYELASVRSQISLLINEQDIFQGTLWENITLGRTEVTQEKVIAYSQAAGLSDYIATLQNGYDTLLDPVGKRLSTNVVHKILLVRALVSEPRLLLLEEPWLSLNVNQQKRMQDVINHLTGVTIVIVTNDEIFAKTCDQVIVLSDGRITVTQNN